MLRFVSNAHLISNSNHTLRFTQALKHSHKKPLSCLNVLHPEYCRQSSSHIADPCAHMWPITRTPPHLNIRTQCAAQRILYATLGPVPHLNPSHACSCMPQCLILALDSPQFLPQTLAFNAPNIFRYAKRLSYSAGQKVPGGNMEMILFSNNMTFVLFLMSFLPQIDLKY